MWNEFITFYKTLTNANPDLSPFVDTYKKETYQTKDLSNKLLNSLLSLIIKPVDKQELSRKYVAIANDLTALLTYLKEDKRFSKLKLVCGDDHAKQFLNELETLSSSDNLQSRGKFITALLDAIRSQFTKKPNVALSENAVRQFIDDEISPQKSDSKRNYNASGENYTQISGHPAESGHWNSFKPQRTFVAATSFDEKNITRIMQYASSTAESEVRKFREDIRNEASKGELITREIYVDNSNIRYQTISDIKVQIKLTLYTLLDYAIETGTIKSWSAAVGFLYTLCEGHKSLKDLFNSEEHRSYIENLILPAALNRTINCKLIDDKAEYLPQPKNEKNIEANPIITDKPTQFFVSITDIKNEIFFKLSQEVNNGSIKDAESAKKFLTTCISQHPFFIKNPDHIPSTLLAADQVVDKLVQEKKLLTDQQGKSEENVSQLQFK
jgi:hypothetical protein